MFNAVGFNVTTTKKIFILLPVNAFGVLFLLVVLLMIQILLYFLCAKMFSLHFFRHLRTNSSYNLDVSVFEWPQTHKSFCQLHINSSLTFCRGLK